MSDGLDKQKRAELHLKNMVRNSEGSERLAVGVADIPVNRIIEQALYLENELLPRMEKSRGKAHVDYKFFEGIIKSLLWCITMADRSDYMQRAIAKERLLREYYQAHSEACERELLKYTTIEDLFLCDALDRVGEGIKKRAAELLTKNKIV
jgi:hypothetical protein